jgi:hypothetical protein
MNYSGVPFNGSAEQYAALVAGRRRFDAKKRRSFKRAQQAIGAEKIAAVNEYLMMLGSHQRLGGMLNLIAHEPADIFLAGVHSELADV